MNLDRIRDENGKLPAYAWPGGYTIVYICHDGGVICPNCANDPSNAEWAFDETSHDRIIGYQVYYEGPTEYCANCNAELESSYGDPDAKDNA